MGEFIKEGIRYLSVKLASRHFYICIDSKDMTEFILEGDLLNVHMRNMTRASKNMTIHMHVGEKPCTYIPTSIQ